MTGQKKKSLALAVLALASYAVAAVLLFEPAPSASDEQVASEYSAESPALVTTTEEPTDVPQVTAPVNNREATPENHYPEDGDPQPRNGGFRYHSNGIPIGFEAWFESQRLALDIFYGGRFLLTALADLKNGEIILLSPEEVAGRIPGVLNQSVMTSLLSQPLASNADKICQQPNQPLCGRLEPGTIGIIFDESRMRADLFINRALLADVPETDPRYLPAGNKDRVTLVQNLNSLYTADDQGNDRYSLFGRTRAGNNGHYSFADWVSTNDQYLSIDQLGYRHDLHDHLFTVGLFEVNQEMLRGMDRDQLIGASMHRSMHRRTDLDAIIATPIDLFLPVRGRVDIYRDERLISSGFYEAGNQRLDTSRLPSGAYLIEVVTTDAAGNISSEQQLFVKSTLLAPPGQPIWFAEAGKVARRNQLETFPDELDVSMLRAGYRWRHASWLGLGVAGATTEQAALGELSANMLFDRFESGAEIFSSSAGGWGFGARAATRFGSHSITASSRYTRADRLPDIDEPQYQLIPFNRWIHNAQYQTRVNKQATLSASISVSGLDSDSAVRRSNVRYNHYFPISGRNSLVLTGDLGEVEGELRITAGIQWRGVRNHWNHSAALQASASDIAGDVDGLSANIASRWSDKDIFMDDVDVNLSAQADAEGHGVTSQLRHGSEFGRGQLAVSHNRRELFEQTQYLAGYDTSLVVDRSWIPAVGGGGTSGESAAILDLRDGEGASVGIYVDGRKQFSARGGRRVPVILNPYAEYSISVEDQGTELISFDGAPRRSVVYPGDVASLHWSMQLVNIIVGRVQRAESFCSEVTGECHTLRLPVMDARVGGLEGFVFTDRDGFFQGEVASGTGTLSISWGGRECEIDIGHLEPENGVIRAPHLLCQIGEL